MPSENVVKKWGFECLRCKYEGEEVKKIWCKLCKEYSGLANVSQSKKGVAKVASETFVKGTSVINKNNFAEHVKKSINHAKAVARLYDRRKQNEGEQKCFNVKQCISNWGVKNANASMN